MGIMKSLVHFYLDNRNYYKSGDRMEALTTEQRKQIVIWKYQEKLDKDIKKEFKEKFNKTAPNVATIAKILEQFEKKGCVRECPNCEESGAYVRKPIYLVPNEDTDIQVEMIINSVKRDPKQSPSYLGTKIFNRPPNLIKVMLHKYGYLWTGKEWINLIDMGSEPGGRFEHLF